MRRTCSLSSLVLLSAFLFTAGLHAQAGTAYLVDVGGGDDVDYTSLSFAAANVPDGSTLVVRSVADETLLIDGKSLTIVADSWARIDLVSSSGPILSNLGADQRVVLRGFTFQGFVGMRVEDCLGEVWFEDCALHGTWNGGGLYVENSPAVTLRGCEVYGGTNYFGDPQTALIARFGSNVQAFGSSFAGAAGGDYFCSATSGAFLDHASTLFAQDCTFLGGGCGGAYFPDAASAIRLRGGAGAVLRNVVATPGVATGANPPPVSVGVGCTLLEAPDVARSLLVDSPLVAGTPATVDLAGAASDAVLVFVSDRPALAVVPAYVSSVAVGTPNVLAAVVPLDPTGLASFQVTPTLAAGVETSTVYVQAIHLGTAIASGRPTAVTILPAGF